MAESYSEERSTDTGVDDGLLTDETVKWLGIGLTGLFSIVVLAAMAYILGFRVDYDLLAQVWTQFVPAYLLVGEIVIISAVLSLIGGVLVGLGRVSRTGFTNRVASAYVEFFRGTPLLFQLFVVYLGIPSLWPPGQFPFDNWSFAAAVIGLTLNHAAYSGEAIRGGINAVPDGQMEAARSVGMSYIDSMRNVVLPQAWRNALPAIGNDLVILIKDTSLLTVLAIPEIISTFRNIYSTNFDAWTPIVLVAVSYLALTIPLGYLVRWAEGRSDWGGDRQ